MLVIFLRFLDFPNVFRKLPECCRESQSASSRQNPAISSKSEHKSAPKISKSRFERILRCHHISFTTVSSFLQLPNILKNFWSRQLGCAVLLLDKIVRFSPNLSTKVLPKSQNLGLNEYWVAIIFVSRRFRAFYNTLTFLKNFWSSQLGCAVLLLDKIVRFSPNLSIEVLPKSQNLGLNKYWVAITLVSRRFRAFYNSLTFYFFGAASSAVRCFSRTN